MLLYYTAGVEGFLIFVYTLHLLYKYAHKDAEAGVKFFTFLGWSLGFSIIAILPIDIYIVTLPYIK
jgi:hypothetical protein